MEITIMLLWAVWSTVLVDDGEQFVTIYGQMLMPGLCVDNWDHPR